jgi:hypothetical protein
MSKLNDLLILLQLFPTKDWNYDWLSSNLNITWEFIKQNPDKPWNYYFLCLRPRSVTKSKYYLSNCSTKSR